MSEKQTFSVGDEVYVRSRGPGQYPPAVVTAVDGDLVTIDYPTLSLRQPLRLPASALCPKETP